MWYEILLPTGFLFATLSIPFVIGGPLWRKFTRDGNIYNRDTDDPWVEHFYFRDLHLSGNPYKPNGIDTLPDEPPKK